MIARIVRSGEMCPRGYGIAWYRYDVDWAIALPIPLNWIAGWIRAAWIHLRHGPGSTAYDRAIVKAGRDGEERGMAWERAAHDRQEQLVRESAYRDGFACGRRSVYDQMMAALDAKKEGARAREAQP